MEITVKLDTGSKKRDEFMVKLTKLAKELGFYGKEKQFAKDMALEGDVSPLNVNQLLRLEIMLGSLEGVVCALLLGADLDYTVKGISNRELVTAYRNKNIMKILDEDVAEKSLTKKKSSRAQMRPKK